jgi:transposase-like protein
MKKQRKFSPELKAKVCLQILSGAKSTAQVCREQQLNEQVVARWKKQFVEQSSLVFEKEASAANAAERVAELERMVGRLTMELEVAKKASAAFDQLSTRSGR